MGLFGKKEVCPVCGKKIKGDLCIKIQGNVYICKDCSAKVNMDANMIPYQTPMDIKEHLLYREKNQIRYDDFESTLDLKIGAYHFMVDEAQKMWFCNANRKDKNPPVFDYDEITGYQFLENGAPYVEEEKRSGLGALFAKKEVYMVNSMKLHIDLSNQYTPTIDIELVGLNDEIKSNSFGYKSNKRAIEMVIGALNAMSGQGSLSDIQAAQQEYDEPVEDVAEPVVEAAEDLVEDTFTEQSIDSGLPQGKVYGEDE